MRIGPSGVLSAMPTPYPDSAGLSSGAAPLSTKKIMPTSVNDGMSALNGNRYSRLATKMLVSRLNPNGSPRTVLGPPRMNRSCSGRQAAGVGTGGEHGGALAVPPNTRATNVAPP